MNDLEKARAEVARLEALEATVAFTIAEKNRISVALHRAFEITDVLGLDRDFSAGNGGGVTVSTVIAKLNDRLDKIETQLSALKGEVQS